MVLTEGAGVHSLRCGSFRSRGVQSVVFVFHELPVRGVFGLKFGVSGQRNVLVYEYILNFLYIDAVGSGAIHDGDCRRYARGLSGAYALRNEIKPVYWRRHR